MSKEPNTDSMIVQMPPSLSNKIAAGEVVQRPSSIVKELLENALDAGAGQIRVEIADAGKTLIRVTDNGCGMNAQDARMAFEPHATSKIRTIEDLYRIRTMGFRGEALSSIASVSKVEMKTRRTGDEAGTRVVLDAGEERVLEPVGCDAGTSIAIKNLFFHVPARRQFLKTDATELKHILRVFESVALAHSDLSFTFVSQQQTLFQLPPQSLTDRVSMLFGKEYRKSLIPFAEETSIVHVTGLLADPKLAKKSRGEQFLFVNGRPFQHRFLTYTILSQFDAWTKQNEYPFYAIFLDIEPDRVDVNVHPAKTEVKFQDERNVVQITGSIIKKALNEYFSVPMFEGVHPAYRGDGGDFSFGSGQPGVPGVPGVGGSAPPWGQTGNPGIRQGRQGGHPIQIPSRINPPYRAGSGGIANAGELLYGDGGIEGAGHPSQSLRGSEAALGGSSSSEGSARPSSSERSDADGGTGADRGEAAQGSSLGFWQLHQSYIVTQTRSGLCLVDQHAAHKRILYERALRATEQDLPGTQQLLFAQTIELSASDFELLKELLQIIQKMGFHLSLMSGNSVMIMGVPADIDSGFEKEVLTSMLAQYRELEQISSLDRRKKVALAFASRSAIRKGRVLREQEMEMLVDQLFACEEPYLDPLQKPTLVYVSMSEIDARFRR